MIPARNPFLASRKSFCFFFSLTVFLFLIAGCAEQKGLVGRWAGDQSFGVTTTSYEVEFHTDGTYSESIDEQTRDNSKPETSNTYRGDFTANASEMTLMAKEVVQNMEANSASSPPQTYFYKLDGNSLTIQTVSGPIALSRRWW